MLRDIFINACILIASISVGDLIFQTPKLDSRRSQMAAGILSGIQGIFLMFFSVQVNETVGMDFRNIAIILSSFYGGPIASISTGLVIGIFRVAYFGLSQSSEADLVNAVILGIVCGLASGLKIKKWEKWALITLLTMVGTSAAFSVTVHDPGHLTTVLWRYWLGTAFMSALIFFYSDYITTVNIHQHSLQIDASVDFLTGLNNVRRFDNILNRAMEHARAKNESLGLLYLDIDSFKAINDKYGHAEGDAVLRQFGKILTENCRSVDFTFRKGGDEFAVLLQNCPAEKVMDIAERIRESVRTYPFQLESGPQQHLTTSIGAASFPETVPDVEIITKSADDALYKAKHAGGNRVETP